MALMIWRMNVSRSKRTCRNQKPANLMKRASAKLSKTNVQWNSASSTQCRFDLIRWGDYYKLDGNKRTKRTVADES